MKQFLAIYLTLSVIIASVRAIKPKQFFYETSLFSWSTEQTYSEGLTDYLEVLDVCDINSSYQYFSDEMLNSTYPREYIKSLMNKVSPLIIFPVIPHGQPQEETEA